VVAFALDGAKDALRDAPDGCGPRPVAVFDSERSSAGALGVRIEQAFDSDGLLGLLVTLNTRLILCGKKDLRCWGAKEAQWWRAMEGRARGAALPLHAVVLPNDGPCNLLRAPLARRLPPVSACAIIAASALTLTTLHIRLTGTENHDCWPPVLARCRSLRSCRVEVSADVPTPEAAAVIDTLQRLEVVDVTVFASSHVKNALVKLLNECDTLVRASVVIVDEGFTRMSDDILPAVRPRFRAFNDMVHVRDPWENGFSSFESITLRASRIPVERTESSTCVRKLGIAAEEASGFGSLSLADVFPSLQALCLFSPVQLEGLQDFACGALSLPPSLTSLTVRGDRVETIRGFSALLHHAVNAFHELRILRCEHCTFETVPGQLLSVRGTLRELDIVGTVPNGTGAVIGQLSALRHLKVPTMATESWFGDDPHWDDAAFLLSKELRELRTVCIGSLKGMSLEAVATACPKLHKVELVACIEPSKYRAASWCLVDTDSTEGMFLRASFAQ